MVIRPHGNDRHLHKTTDGMTYICMLTSPSTRNATKELSEAGIAIRSYHNPFSKISSGSKKNKLLTCSLAHWLVRRRTVNGFALNLNTGFQIILTICFWVSESEWSSDREVRDWKSEWVAMEQVEWVTEWVKLEDFEWATEWVKLENFIHISTCVPYSRSWKTAIVGNVST